MQLLKYMYTSLIGSLIVLVTWLSLVFGFDTNVQILLAILNGMLSLSCICAYLLTFGINIRNVKR